MRADAARNRASLLVTARDIFATEGVDVSFDEIARRAGVGNATLYRHFPTRRDLVVAVYSDEVDALCADAERLLTADDPTEALFGWARTFVAHIADKRDLLLAIPADDDRSVLFDGWHAAMRSAVAGLLGRAQAVGAVRADVAPEDLVSLAHGIAMAGADPDRVDRMLSLVRRGAV